MPPAPPPARGILRNSNTSSRGRSVSFGDASAAPSGFSSARGYGTRPTTQHSINLGGSLEPSTYSRGINTGYTYPGSQRPLTPSTPTQPTQSTQPTWGYQAPPSYHNSAPMNIADMYDRTRTTMTSGPNGDFERTVNSTGPLSNKEVARRLGRTVSNPTSTQQTQPTRSWNPLSGIFGKRKHAPAEEQTAEEEKRRLDNLPLTVSEATRLVNEEKDAAYQRYLRDLQERDHQARFGPARPSWTHPTQSTVSNPQSAWSYPSAAPPPYSQNTVTSGQSNTISNPHSYSYPHPSLGQSTGSLPATQSTGPATQSAGPATGDVRQVIRTEHVGDTTTVVFDPTHAVSGDRYETTEQDADGKDFTISFTAYKDPTRRGGLEFITRDTGATSGMTSVGTSDQQASQVFRRLRQFLPPQARAVRNLATDGPCQSAMVWDDLLTASGLKEQPDAEFDTLQAMIQKKGLDSALHLEGALSAPYVSQRERIAEAWESLTSHITWKNETERDLMIAWATNLGDTGRPALTTDAILTDVEQRATARGNTVGHREGASGFPVVTTEVTDEERNRTLARTVQSAYDSTHGSERERLRKFDPVNLASNHEFHTGENDTFRHMGRPGSRYLTNAENSNAVLAREELLKSTIDDIRSTYEIPQVDTHKLEALSAWYTTRDLQRAPMESRGEIFDEVDRIALQTYGWTKIPDGTSTNASSWSPFSRIKSWWAGTGVDEGSRLSLAEINKTKNSGPKRRHSPTKIDGS